MTAAVTMFLADYAAWSTRRAELSAQEETGTAPADDWAASDDEAVELLRVAAANIDPDGVAATPEQLLGAYTDDAWRAEVAAGDTVLGFAAWRVHQYEASQS